jgi:hypothetical protein
MEARVGSGRSGSRSVSAGPKHLVSGANRSSPQRRTPGNASNPGLRNCNLLACIRVLFSTDRRGGAGKTYAANA